MVVACGAIFFSSFSTAALTFFTCWVMLFIGRVRVRELWRLIALVVVVMAAAVTVMYMFNIGRSHTWVNRLGLGDALSKTEQVQVQNDGGQTCRRSRRRSRSPREVSPAKGPGNSAQRSRSAARLFRFRLRIHCRSTVWSARVTSPVLYLCVFFRGES
ncbi:MAG: hypothetical protein ACLR8Y_00255 [Alistipes indistinctus]